MVKVIFIDIDGTLVNSAKQVTDRTKKAIKMAVSNGFLIVICSGRPRAFVERISKEGGASPYIISSNGAEVYNYQTKQVLYRECLSLDICHRLLKFMRQSRVKLIFQTGDREILYDANYDLDFHFQENEVLQVVLYGDNYAKIKSLRPKLEEIPALKIIYQSDCLYDMTKKIPDIVNYDIVSPYVSKGNGIQAFCKLLGISIQQTIGIGDNYNDIDMFQSVNYVAVMGNANEVIKSYGNQILKSNEEDGVAIFLEQLVQKKT